jgi:asparagine synthase (glutamine-hydrolysing)
MCGIAGVLLPQATLPRAELEARLWAMTETVRHRGPDDQEIWTDGLAGLVQARLAIIDLSSAANQPIASQDGSVWLTFNGEIYNFAGIRADLEKLGYVFRSRGHRQWLACLGASCLRPHARHVCAGAVGSARAPAGSRA